MTTETSASTTLTGRSIIAGEPVTGRDGGTVQAVVPATGQPLEPAYSFLDEDQLREATAAAAEALPVLRDLAPAEHAELLDRIAAELEAAGDELVARAMAETGLPEPRLRGELGRTAGQLRLFGTVVRAGDYRGVRVDPALPDRTPLPRPDIRQLRVPVGPVAVFGASNFPLAFSVAGGDTAAALAAGCPVLVKAHNAHPGTAEIAGRAVTRAVAASGLPAGTFSLLYGAGSRLGQQLATDPEVAAVGFTGSRAAGTALVRAAAGRPVPIPVYAEMSSLNPVVVLPGALADPAPLASGYVASVTGSSGQLCTAPGLLFVPEGEAGDRLADAVREALAPVAGQTMLTAGVASAWREGVERLAARPGVSPLAEGQDGPNGHAPAPVGLTTDVATFLADEVLHEEVFGAASLVVRYRGLEDLTDVAARLEGQLTATVHLGEEDRAEAAVLLPLLERRVGRIVVGGWPTGVDVGHAMVHGGPWPATSAPATTSVGTAAIERFLRPVAYQGVPDELLPQALQQANPWGVPRRVDGEYQPGAGAGR